LKPRQCFGLTSTSFYELKEATRSNAIGHFCVRNFDDFGLNWISKLCVPLFNPDPFGLKFYADEEAKINTIELKNARERRIALEAMGNLLIKKEIHVRAVEMIIRVADELLMNAIYDAPYSHQQGRYRKELSREEDFPLEGKERVFLNLVFNKDFVVMSIQDQFGSFVAHHAFEAAKKDYTEHAYRANAAVQGAGLGLHGIATSGVGTMISCKTDVATEAVIAFPYYKSFKETKKGFSSFSFNVR
jgi:hypothetical protein